MCSHIPGAAEACGTVAEHEKMGLVEDFCFVSTKEMACLDVGGYSGFAGDIDYWLDLH